MMGKYWRSWYFRWLWWGDSIRELRDIDSNYGSKEKYVIVIFFKEHFCYLT